MTHGNNSAGSERFSLAIAAKRESFTPDGTSGGTSFGDLQAARVALEGGDAGTQKRLLGSESEFIRAMAAGYASSSEVIEQALALDEPLTNLILLGNSDVPESHVPSLVESAVRAGWDQHVASALRFRAPSYDALESLLSTFPDNRSIQRTIAEFGRVNEIIDRLDLDDKQVQRRLVLNPVIDPSLRDDLFAQDPLLAAPTEHVMLYIDQIDLTDPMNAVVVAENSHVSDGIRAVLLDIYHAEDELGDTSAELIHHILILKHVKTFSLELAQKAFQGSIDGYLKFDADVDFNDSQWGKLASCILREFPRQINLTGVRGRNARQTPSMKKAMDAANGVAK